MQGLRGSHVVVVLTVEEQTEKCEEQIEFLTKKKEFVLL